MLLKFSDKDRVVGASSDHVILPIVVVAWAANRKDLSMRIKSILECVPLGGSSMCSFIPWSVDISRFLSL